MTEHSDTAQQPARQRRTRLAEMVAAPPELDDVQPFGRETWLKIGILTALVVATYYWRLPHLVNMWRHDPNWGHGWLIPLFSLYLLYARRDEIRAAERRTCLWGLPMFLLGLLGQIVAFSILRNPWTASLSLLLTLFGLVLYLAGPRIIRLTWLPIVFLVFAIPLPSRLYTAIALPLQTFAAGFSALLLKIGGVDINPTQSTLEIVTVSGKSLPLTVAEACSGVRSLMAFVAIGVAIAYLENRPAWQRVVLVVATVPIAILCNVIRVTITCTAYYFDKPEFGKDFMHTFLGMVMLIPAFLMLLGLGWLLQRVSTTENVEDDEPAAAQEDAST